MWLEKFGDPDARFRVALSKIVSRYLFRISSDVLLPYDFTEIQPYASKALTALVKKGNVLHSSAEFEALQQELDSFHAIALQLQKEIQSRKQLSPQAGIAVNEFLLDAIKAFNGTNRNVLMESSGTSGCVGEALSELSDAFRADNEDQILVAANNLKRALTTSRQFLEKVIGILKSK
jgi:hypothetical protein